MHFNQTDYSAGTFLSTHEGFKITQQRKGFAFHCDAFNAFPVIRETFEQNQLCDLNMISFREELLGFVVPKQSPFKSLVASK